jgi:hypothetical protein
MHEMEGPYVLPARSAGSYDDHPVSRFWGFHGIEAGIVMGLSRALIALACLLVLTREA